MVLAQGLGHADRQAPWNEKAIVALARRLAVIMHRIRVGTEFRWPREIPYWKGPGADSEEKREPVSDIDIAGVDSLKVLDPKWPIREADIAQCCRHVSKVLGVDIPQRRGQCYNSF